MPRGVRVGSSVSEVMAAFVASLAGMWRNHDDRVMRLNRRCLQSRSSISAAEVRKTITVSVRQVQDADIFN